MLLGSLCIGSRGGGRGALTILRQKKGAARPTSPPPRSAIVSIYMIYSIQKQKPLVPCTARVEGLME